MCQFRLSVLVSRLEEKESETRTEYSKLHERYTDVRTCMLLLWKVLFQMQFLHIHWFIFMCDIYAVST